MELVKLLKIKKTPSNLLKALFVGFLLCLPTLEALAQSTGPRNGPLRPRAGVISTTSPTVVCASDGIADIVRVTVRGVIGTSNWFVTDESGVILGKTRGVRTFSPNLEGAGRGTCFIYHVANRGYIRNVPVGGNIGSLIGNIRFSNRIGVTRLIDCNGPVDSGFTPLSARSMTVSGDRISLSGLSRATTPRVIVKVRDAVTGREFDSRILYVPEFEIQSGGSARI